MIFLLKELAPEFKISLVGTQFLISFGSLWGYLNY